MKMDASASNKAQINGDISLNSFFLHVQNRSVRSMTANQHNTVIKFTKLPEYDFDSQVIWPQKSSYVLQPHLRRIVTLDDEDNFISTTSRSLRNELPTAHKLMSSTYSRRKIVTITEEDDKKSVPSLTTPRKALSNKLESGRCSSASSQKTEKSDIKLFANKNASHGSVSSRCLNKIDTKLNAKTVALSSRKINNEPKYTKNLKTSSPIARTQTQTPNRDTKLHAPENKTRFVKEKEKPQANKKSYLTNKTTSNISKTSMNSNLSIQGISNEFPANRRGNMMGRTRNSSVIKVPLEQRGQPSHIIETRVAHFKIQPISNSFSQVDCNTEIDKRVLFANIGVGTDQKPEKANVNIGTEYEPINKSVKDSVNVSVQTINYLKSHFDSLDVPDVSLIKDKNDEPKEDIVKQNSNRLSESDLQVPAIEKTSHKGENETPKNESYVIGCDSVTCTTQNGNRLSESELRVPAIEDNSHRRDNKAYKNESYVIGCGSVTCTTQNGNRLSESELRVPAIEDNSHRRDNKAYKNESYVIGCGSVTCTTQNGNRLSESELRVPAIEDTSHRRDNKTYKNESYVIGCGSVTYTTKQKIDFRVVSKKEEAVLSGSSSPLVYPMNVLSVFKKENVKKEACETQLDYTEKKKDKVNSEHSGPSHNCSYDDTHKLVKPSELISTIRLNNGLLQSDYICEQFQRELNFIDSFFESLQYLENCSLSNKSFTDTSVERWASNSGFDVNVISPEYDSLFSKFENGTNIDDTETIASKSLCLLNLLIRDEQRRAKNLLFVLKMREDALKDFTKSQILWLENKKKHDNIDIPTLKKKQRGVLLKLQHECGEMQRMRKALLALSEKRKVALIKTKKNIELKLKNNVSVDQILLGKKKLKRNSISDRPTVPLKCFDLSSSGCDDSTTSRAKSESALVISKPDTAPPPAQVTIRSAEKSIQTGESLLSSSQVDESTDTTTELFVTVDGGYLNILFNNFSLPEIFSYGKNYEVNQEALKTIVNSANNQNITGESSVVEKFIDQIKHRDQDRSTTPSTARSLVEEFDQYYKGLVDDDQLSVDSSEPPYIKETVVELVEVTTEPKVRFEETESLYDISAMANEFKNTEIQIQSDESKASVPVSETHTNSTYTKSLNSKKAITIATQAGPLPVPAGAAAGPDVSPSPDIPTILPIKSSTTFIESTSSVPSYMDSPLVTSLVSPVQNEAEELRRQQLAIEREIKALEQQQCHLLVVREIPDKPPPPYIPPAEARPPRPTRMFTADDTVEQKVEKHLAYDTSFDNEPTDAFDIFLHDFCQESAEKHKKDLGDKPWDACNLLPQKPPLTHKNLVQKTAAELKEVLKGVQPCLVSNVSTRRSDHIDDVLFAEWRRYEADWTALHTDEAVIKGQLFEGIFQSILVKTVQEYKKILQRDCHVTKSD